jgi:hypothetical protein
VIGFLVVRRADGKLKSDQSSSFGHACIGVGDTFTTAPPARVATVRGSGKRTVSMAAGTQDTRVGYIALNAKDSAMVAAQTGGPTGVPYYVVCEIPSDNSQSVLVSILQQQDFMWAIRLHSKNHG